MSAGEFDYLTGKLEVVDKPVTLSWTNPLEFIERLKKIIRVKFPVNKGNDFIVSGWIVPSTDDTGRMWARFDQNRNWLGWFAFVKGKWRRVYNYRSDEIIWLVGNSNDIPEGFSLISNTSQLSLAIRNEILSRYVETSPGSGVYSYFAVRWIGY